MNERSINTTEINSDFAKLQQNYNLLNELFQTIITKSQINENHINDINQQLTTSLENMSDGFVAINEKWEYTFVNQKAALLFSKSPEELIGKSLWSIFPEAIGTPFHKAYYKAMKTKK